MKQVRDRTRGKLFSEFIKPHLGSPNQARVLDAGCKYGAFTFGMKDYFDTIVGMGLDKKAIKEAQTHAADYDNVSIFEGDILQSGFKDSSFDLVVLEGVLEWVGNSDHSASPSECQRQALQECRRLLDSSGLLYVGIENRLFPYFWIDDPHGNLPLLPILPSSVANKLNRLIRGEEYHQRILSYWGYQSLIGKYFDTVEILIPVPHYKYLHEVSSFNDSELREKINSVRDQEYEFPNTYELMINWLQIMSRFHATKIFAPNFVIIARKS